MSAPQPAGLAVQIRSYWSDHISDAQDATHPIGSERFFSEVEARRSTRLDYLPKVVDFSAYKRKRLLEVGCGIGMELVRFAKHGAVVTGVDLAENIIRLAKWNFEFHGVEGDLRVMDGEALQFDDESFDVAFAYGLFPYATNVERIVEEIRRVLKPGGEAILMVYNRHSWLNFLSHVGGQKYEHENAPVFRKHSLREFRSILSRFSDAKISYERYPVRTRLPRGMKTFMYNAVFVRVFNLLPKALVRPLGSHLIAKAIK